MTGRRGVLPLALLIVAALVAGVAIALVRLGDGEEPRKAVPSPTAPKSPPTTKTPSPQGTQSPIDKTPSPQGTQSPQGTMSPSPDDTLSPSPDETLSPSPDETQSPGGGGQQTPDDGATPLAKTGGETFPWLFFGALLVGVSVLLGRLARRPG